jgi:hypothetical protein
MQEIYQVLERFDSISFVGDKMALQIYAGLNTLLRDDLMFGASCPWNMDAGQQNSCQCGGQFSFDCVEFLVNSSWEINDYAVDERQLSRMSPTWRPYSFNSQPLHRVLTEFI